MYKNSLKLRNIADLQALTPGRVKKITLYKQVFKPWFKQNLLLKFGHICNYNSDLRVPVSEYFKTYCEISLTALQVIII